MDKKLMMLGALGMLLAVALGAFGAHALKAMLESTGRADTYQTAVSYHFYHSLGLLFIGLYSRHNPEALVKYAGILIATGLFVFSGSLYLLCFTGIGVLGAITPIGGVAFIVGWALLFLAFYRDKFS
jgi:uncharacterized membrane protein YgdD (TMEM256/DUF423 family)